MDLDTMTPTQLRELIDEAQEVLARLEAEDTARQAVDAAVQAYADGQHLTVLQAWRALAPQEVAVPDDPEPEPLPDAPEYVNPSGAHDAYNTGDLVTHKGKVYRARMDGVVWSPAAYPQAWEELR